MKITGTSSFIEFNMENGFIAKIQGKIIIKTDDLLYSRVRYIGHDDKENNLRNNDIGYIIEDYNDGNYEVEFSEPNTGVDYALCVINIRFLRKAE